MKKVIHYCWFGGNPLTPLSKKCIQSWKKYLPDYKIKKWDESNFKIEDSIDFVKKAYHDKKWAFVSDYVRLWVIYNYGGIYLDTDVELINNLVGINPNFFAIESGKNFIATGLGFGADPKSELLRDHMKIYENEIKYNVHDLPPCPNVTTHFFEINGFKITNPNINHNFYEFTIYSPEYFSPFNYYNKELNITNKTKSIHHYAESWK